MQDRHTEQPQNKKLARLEVHRILSERSDEHGEVSHTHSELNTEGFWQEYATGELTAEMLHESYRSFFIKKTNDDGLRNREALVFEAVLADCQPVRKFTTQDKVIVLSLEDVEYFRERIEEATKEFHAEIKERKTKQRAEETRFSEENLEERANSINDILHLHTNTIVDALNRRKQIQAQRQLSNNSSWTRWLCCCFFSSPPVPKVDPEQILAITALLNDDTPYRIYLKNASLAEKRVLKQVLSENRGLKPINKTILKEYAESLANALNLAQHEGNIIITPELETSILKGIEWVNKEQESFGTLLNIFENTHHTALRSSF